MKACSTGSYKFLIWTKQLKDVSIPPLVLGYPGVGKKLFMNTHMTEVINNETLNNMIQKNRDKISYLANRAQLQRERDYNA